MLAQEICQGHSKSSAEMKHFVVCTQHPIALILSLCHIIYHFEDMVK